MTKTYEQRLAEIAEELAKVEYKTLDDDTDTFKAAVINHYLPLAAIALKHMAEERRLGINEGVLADAEFLETPIEQHLKSLGLQPQKP